MVDISKCDGKGCPKKERCYRYTVKGDPNWQSYVDAPRNEEGSCRLFWDNEEMDKKLNDKLKLIYPTQDRDEIIEYEK